MGVFSSHRSKTYLVLNKPLHCLVCAHDEFEQRSALLNTSAATFFGFDWANRSANCFVCNRCGYIHWFVPK